MCSDTAGTGSTSTRIGDKQRLVEGEPQDAVAPVWCSIPRVAELPRSRSSSAMLLYWVRISPFSKRTMLKSIRREVSGEDVDVAELDHVARVGCASAARWARIERLGVDLEVVPVPVDGAVGPPRGRD